MQTGRPNPYWIAKVINQFGLIPVKGDVFGPGSSVAGDIPTFADNTGKLLKDSGIPLQGIFSTQTAAAAATIASTVSFVMTAGRAAVGDYGAALYKKVGGASAGGFQSADGQWWGLALTTVTPQMFGDCSGECHAAIQGAINYIGGINGGTVFFPGQTYLIDTTLNLTGTVILQGVASQGSLIQCNIDTTVLSCVTAGNCTTQDIFLYNSFATPTSNVLEIDSTTVAMTMRDCSVLGGVAAINIFATDCLFENVTATGNSFNVFSHGANWYLRCKLDNELASPVALFFQSTPVVAGKGQENNLTMCDLSYSGAGTPNSVTINDGGGTLTAFTTFVGCVFSHPIVITSAKGSMFSACEVGSTTFSAGTSPTAVTGCWASTAIVVSGAGKVVSGCVNIT